MSAAPATHAEVSDHSVALKLELDEALRANGKLAVQLHNALTETTQLQAHLDTVSETVAYLYLTTFCVAHLIHTCKFKKILKARKQRLPQFLRDAESLNAADKETTWAACGR